MITTDQYAVTEHALGLPSAAELTALANEMYPDFPVPGVVTPGISPESASETAGVSQQQTAAVPEYEGNSECHCFNG